MSLLACCEELRHTCLFGGILARVGHSAVTALHAGSMMVVRELYAICACCIWLGCTLLCWPRIRDAGSLRGRLHLAVVADSTVVLHCYKQLGCGVAAWTCPAPARVLCCTLIAMLAALAYVMMPFWSP